MEVLTGEQMRRIDRRAIDQLGLSGLQLMENAGRGVAEALRDDYPDAAGLGVLVLCGKGNNGGDGLVAARYLALAGVPVEVVLLAPASALAPDAAHNLGRAREHGVDVHEAPDLPAWERERPRLARQGLILDALLGTGVHGPVQGLLAAVIEDLNRAGRHVVAVDVPSGADADRAEVAGPAVRSERTYTLCRPKLALALAPAAALCGAWRVIPIGIPDEAVAAEHPNLSWLDAAAVAVLVRPRPPECHKGMFGHLLAVAGSADRAGAATLLARGALRCGAGLVTVATPAGARERIGAQQPELMTAALPETPRGTLASGAVPVALELVRDASALAIGPGLGRDGEAQDAARRIVERSRMPVVVDADALWALARRGASGPRVAFSSPAHSVLTPHPGEAAHMLACSAADVQAARLTSASRLAREFDAVVVLKGHRTLVAAPDGRVAINSTGNPGMAQGGMGDVLTGAVGAFLARGMSAWDAARLAVYVHGDAGDRCSREIGPEGYVAGELALRLPRALRALASA